ncbi:hypothetical protein [Empedobacter falsenii]
MDLEELQQKLKENFINICCTNSINGKDVLNTTLLKILIQKLESIGYEDWNHQNFNKNDVRMQLFVKFDFYTSYYFHNINLTIENYDKIVEDNLELGYSYEFSSESMIFKEVYERTNYLSKFFFDLEYFLQQVNKKISYSDATKSKKKNYFFNSLINKIGIENSLNINCIIMEINRIYGSDLLFKVKDRKIEYSLIFDYLTTFRNSLHNNGFSQKTLNKIDFGGILIEIKQNEQVNINHCVLFILIFCQIVIFEKIVKKLLVDYPELWQDEYLNHIETKRKFY